jgi:hypothetical protein
LVDAMMIGSEDELRRNKGHLIKEVLEFRRMMKCKYEDTVQLCVVTHSRWPMAHCSQDHLARFVQTCVISCSISSASINLNKPSTFSSLIPSPSPSPSSTSTPTTGS